MFINDSSVAYVRRRIGSITRLNIEQTAEILDIGINVESYNANKLKTYRRQIINVLLMKTNGTSLFTKLDNYLMSKIFSFIPYMPGRLRYD
jgi:hypothetical protein